MTEPNWVAKTGKDEINWNERYANSSICQAAARGDVASVYTINGNGRPSIFGEAALAVEKNIAPVFSKAGVTYTYETWINLAKSFMPRINEELVQKLTGADTRLNDAASSESVNKVYELSVDIKSNDKGLDTIFNGMRTSIAESVNLLASEAAKRLAVNSPAAGKE